MLRYWKTIFWAIIILILSGLSGDKVSEIDFFNIPHIDKVFHLGMYFILAFLWLFELKGNTVNEKTNPFIILFILIICIAYGILMEYFQDVFFNKRSAEIGDAVANGFGTILSVPAIYFLRILFSNRQKQ